MPSQSPISYVDEERQPFVVYGDFNCPFCYAHSYRLVELGLVQATEWRLLQHSPQASSSHVSLHDIAELTSEVSQLKRRAPDIPIQVPRFRPNTRLATEKFILALGLDEKKAQEFRMQVYTALWVDGRDISRRKVLKELWKKAGFDPSEDPEGEEETAAVVETADAWQNEWEAGGFDRRIPSMVDQQGACLLGLPTISKLTNFMKGRVTEGDAELVCEARARPRILVLSQSDSVHETIKRCIGMICDIENSHRTDYEELVSLRCPDLIVADLDSFEGELEQLMYLLVGKAEGQIPVIIASEKSSPVEEAEAFARGAADFLRIPALEPIVRARLSAQIQNKMVADQLGRMARVDHLTGLDNRREFDRVLQREWRRCQRLAHSLAILVIDIDFFKRFNDHFGHGDGDECLRAVADALTKSLERSGDLVARIGGEEFAAILPNTDLSGARTVGEKMRASVASLAIPHPRSTIAPHVTISIGGDAVVPYPNRTASELVHTADLALYRAKNHGRNQCVVLTETTVDEGIAILDTKSNTDDP